MFNRSFISISLSPNNTDSIIFNMSRDFSSCYELRNLVNMAFRSSQLHNLQRILASTDNLKFLVIVFVWMAPAQNSKSTHATILQLLVAKFATQSWRYCNPKLKSHYAICSCSYSNYQLKKIATKSCLQLKLAIHAFLQLLVELWLHSGCIYLQCSANNMSPIFYRFILQFLNK